MQCKCVITAPSTLSLSPCIDGKLQAGTNESLQYAGRITINVILCALWVLHIHGAWMCLVLFSWPKATPWLRAWDFLTATLVANAYCMHGVWWSWPCGCTFECLRKQGFAYGEELFQGALWIVVVWVCLDLDCCDSIYLYEYFVCLVKLFCCTMGSLISQHPVLFVPVYVVCVWSSDPEAFQYTLLGF